MNEQTLKRAKELSILIEEFKSVIIVTESRVFQLNKCLGSYRIDLKKHNKELDEL